MKLYAGIDLHSNNCVVVVLDDNDRVLYQKRLANELAGIVAALRSCAGELQGVAVESTYNWYWLVDGLQDAGFAVHLVNTAAVKQYDGLKYAGDVSDARHLAHLLHLGILTRQWDFYLPINICNGVQCLPCFLIAIELAVLFSFFLTFSKRSFADEKKQNVKWLKYETACNIQIHVCCYRLFLAAIHSNSLGRL